MIDGINLEGGEQNMFLLLLVLGVLLFGFGFIGFLIKLAVGYIVLLLVLGVVSVIAGFLLRQ